jgi:Mn-containing catalase
VSDKPSYLGLLNAISLSEASNYRLLVEWVAVTKDPEVRQVLLMLAGREGEHGMTFARRINELGYEVRPGPEDGTDPRLEIIRSDCSDLEKMERALGLTDLDTTAEPDIFERYFTDHSIDIRTGELLGRFIAEERDSERKLRQCYACLREAVHA